MDPRDVQRYRKNYAFKGKVMMTDIDVDTLQRNKREETSILGVCIFLKTSLNEVR